MAQFTSDDKATFTNKRIFDQLSFIFDAISLWGCGKSPNQTFYDYLVTNKGFSDAKLRRALYPNYSMSHNKNFKGLDFSFACDILPFLCNGIADVKKWPTITNVSMIEYKLHELQNLRNGVMHEPLVSAVDPNLLAKVERITLEILDAAELLFSPGTDKLDEVKSKLLTLVVDIKKVVSTSKEAESEQYKRLIIEEGIPELRKKLEMFRDNPQSIFQYVKSFYDIQLSEGDTKFSCKNVLQYISENSDQRILIIQGQSGSGKSFLLKEIQRQILQNEENSTSFKETKKFHVPFLFKCKSLSCRTLPDLVRQTIPTLSKKLRDSELIDSGLSQVKCLFLIDGLDEMNSDSKAFIEEALLPFLKNNRSASCIFTSRLHPVKPFEEVLAKTEFSHKIFELLDLTTNEEQMNFLKLSCENGEHNSCVYDSTNLDLRSPLQLSIFAFFCIEDSKRIKSSSHLMREAIEYSKTRVIERLNQRGDQKWLSNADVFIEKISFISFYLLVNGKLDVSSDSVEWLQEQIGTLVGYVDISSSEILSCFFHHQTSGSDSADNPGIYEFYHKSHQEVFAAIYLFDHITELEEGFSNFCVNLVSNYEGISKEDCRKNLKSRGFRIKENNEEDFNLNNTTFFSR